MRDLCARNTTPGSRPRDDTSARCRFRDRQLRFRLNGEFGRSIENKGKGNYSETRPQTRISSFRSVSSLICLLDPSSDRTELHTCIPISEETRRKRVWKLPRRASRLGCIEKHSRWRTAAPVEESISPGGRRTPCHPPRRRAPPR